MHIFRPLTPLLLSLLPLATCHRPQFQRPLISPQPLLRNATLEDADDIASVVIAAFSPTPAWQYIYQFHKSNPKEHHRCVRSGITQVLTSPEYVVEVVEAPDDAKGDLTIAAAAAWRPNFTMGEDEDEDGLDMFVSRITSESSRGRGVQWRHAHSNKRTMPPPRHEPHPRPPLRARINNRSAKVHRRAIWCHAAVPGYDRCASRLSAPWRWDAVGE